MGVLHGHASRVPQAGSAAVIRFFLSFAGWVATQCGLDVCTIYASPCSWRVCCSCLSCIMLTLIAPHPPPAQILLLLACYRRLVKTWPAAGTTWVQRWTITCGSVRAAIANSWAPWRRAASVRGAAGGDGGTASGTEGAAKQVGARGQGLRQKQRGRGTGMARGICLGPGG